MFWLSVIAPTTLLSSSSCFQWPSSDKPAVLPARRQAEDKVSYSLVNIVEHLGAEDSHIAPQDLVETKKRTKSEWLLDFHLSGGHKHDPNKL